MMDVFQAIRARVSHKEDFLDEPVPQVYLEAIAEAGALAPTGANRQTVHFVVLPTKEKVLPLASIVPTWGMQTAHAAIAVATDPSLNIPNHPSLETEDYAIAMAFMSLAATSLGLSTLWLDSPFWDKGRNDAAKALLGLPAHFKLWAVLPVGTPANPSSTREKLPPSARIFYNQYKEQR